MSPVNTKSLLAFIFTQMEALANNDIDATTACAQAKLASQACNVLNYELKRTIVQMKLQETGNALPPSQSQVFLREVESKPFDNTTTYDHREQSQLI